MFGVNPKKIQEMMSKLGMEQKEIEADRVVIEKEDKNIIINNPQIIKINMQGQENFQISGDISEEEKESEVISEEDIKQVAEKTRKSEEQARKALEESDGDLAEAILSLS